MPFLARYAKELMKNLSIDNTIKHANVSDGIIPASQIHENIANALDADARKWIESLVSCELSRMVVKDSPHIYIDCNSLVLCYWEGIFDSPVMPSRIHLLKYAMDCLTQKGYAVHPVKTRFVFFNQKATLDDATALKIINPRIRPLC